MIATGQYGRLFAVVHFASHQWKVTSEDLILIHNELDVKCGERIRLEKVLLVGADGFTLVGKKDLVRVEATVIEKTESWPKVNMKFKKRKNYRRKRSEWGAWPALPCRGCPRAPLNEDRAVGTGDPGLDPDSCKLPGKSSRAARSIAARVRPLGGPVGKLIQARRDEVVTQSDRGDQQEGGVLGVGRATLEERSLAF
uniref:Large ribosomal subunit protein bL21m n=1 Tax=Spermophilus dauricus TaxID=99837 RepID=A0A8C9PDA4_SPEDA